MKNETNQLTSKEIPAEWQEWINYENEMSIREGQVIAMESLVETISDLTSQISELTKSIASLKSDLNSLSNEVSDLVVVNEEMNGHFKCDFTNWSISECVSSLVHELNQYNKQNQK